MANLYDKASLVLPTSPAYKDGAIQAYKPLTSQGTFDFSRGSNLAATRVNADGLIEKGRENNILQSNQFNTTWGTADASVTSGQSGYDGSSDAWLLSKSAANGRLFQQPTFSGVTTFSLYVKAGTLDFIRIEMSAGTTDAYFNLSTGAVGTTNSLIDSSIEQVGATDWYRCSITFNNSSTNYIIIFPADADGNTSGTSGSIYIQDAQLEQGLVATDYIETGSEPAQAGILEDMPRLDYSGGASCPALLLEPQRSNLVTNSEYFSSSDYTLDSITTTNNAVASPEGVNNACEITRTSASGNARLILGNKVVSSGAKVCISIFAKENTAKDIILYNTISSQGKQFDLSNGTAGDDFINAPDDFGIEDYGNGWYRCYIVVTAPSTTMNSWVYISEASTSSVYFYGQQMEEGSYPTSYIPTYGTSQTRSKENSYKASISDLIGQEQGTLFAEVDISHLDGTTARDLFFLSNTDYVSDDWIGIGFSGVGSNTLRGRIIDSGSLKFDQYGTISSTGRYKIALAYENGNGAFYVNGVSFGTNYVNTNFSLTLDRIFNAPVGFSTQFADDVKQLLVFPTRLTNAELADLTTL